MQHVLQRITPKAQGFMDWTITDPSTRVILTIVSRFLFGPRAVMTALITKTIRDKCPALLFFLWPLPPILSLLLVTLAECAYVVMVLMNNTRHYFPSFIKSELPLFGLIFLRFCSLNIPEQFSMISSGIMLMAALCAHVVVSKLLKKGRIERDWIELVLNNVILFALQSPLRFLFRLEVLRSGYAIVGFIVMLATAYAFIHPAYERFFLGGTIALAICGLPSIPLLPDLYLYAHELLVSVLQLQAFLSAMSTIGFMVVLIGVVYIFDTYISMHSTVFVIIAIALIEW